MTAVISQPLHGQRSVAITARQMRPQWGSGTGFFPSPGYFGVYQLNTSRFDCSKSEEEGKNVRHEKTNKLAYTIVVETPKGEQMQSPMLQNRRLHCHAAYVLKFWGWAH